MLSAAATALVCALAALNRSAETFPRIEFLDTVPAYASVGTEAFARRSTNTIYIIASSSVVRNAAGRQPGQCGDVYEVKKLASILIHEEWHLKNGPDEKSAYERQLIALQAMGVGPGVAVYHDVQMSMLHVLNARKRNPVTMLAEK